MILRSQAEANAACERPGWVLKHTARQLAYGRNHDDLVREAAEGRDGDPFAGFPENGQP